MVYAVCVSSPLRHFFFLPPLASFLAPAAAGSSSGPCHGHRKSTKRRSLCTCQPRSTALVIRHGVARHGRVAGALQRTSSYEASVAASLITSPSKKSVWSSGASSSSVASVSFTRPTTPAVTQARRRAGARRQAGGAFSCRRRCSARPATPLGAQRDHPDLNPYPNPGPCPSPNPDPDPNPDPSPTVRWRRRGAGAAARSGVAQHAHRHACA